MKGQRLLALALVLLSAVPVAAQGMQPITTIANFNVNPGDEQEFLGLVREFNGPVLDKLMQDGTVMAWGVSSPVMHQPGAPTHSVWWSTPSMAEMDRVLAALEANEKEKLAKQPELLQRFVEIVDLSMHSDMCFRDLVYSGGSAAVAPGAKPYTWIYTVKVVPGQEGQYHELWRESTFPVLQKLVDDGMVRAFGLTAQEIISTDAFTHFTWFSVPSFTAYERVRDVLMTERLKRSPEEQGRISEQYLNSVVPGSERSMVLRQEIFKGAPASGGK